jgi:hypothetical protein
VSHYFTFFSKKRKTFGHRRLSNQFVGRAQKSTIMPQSLSSLSQQIYYVVSALFFGASAYAQLNDPDPFYWVMGYILAGCMIQLLPTLLGSSLAVYCRIIARSISIVNGVILARFVYDIIPMLDFSLPIVQMGWNFLELEEGREIIGLLLLFLHGLLVQSMWQGANNNKRPMGGSLPSLGLVVAFMLLGTAVYLWVYYQPAMVAKYQTAHCAGQFHDPLVATNTMVTDGDESAPTASHDGGEL